MKSTAIREAGSIKAAAYQQQLEQRLAGLKEKHRMRSGKTAYADNIKPLEAEIAKLERIIAVMKDPASIAQDDLTNPAK